MNNDFIELAFLNPNCEKEVPILIFLWHYAICNCSLEFLWKSIVKFQFLIVKVESHNEDTSIAGDQYFLFETEQLASLLAELEVS